MSQSWLDRFSAQSAPPAAPPSQRRSYSPATKRPNAPQIGGQSRPSLSHRSSTLSIASEASGARQSPIPRGANGSSLKNELEPATPTNIQDPLDALRTLICTYNQQNLPSKNNDVELFSATPVELTEDIDFGALDLHNFIESESKSSKTLTRTQEYTAQSLEEYEDDKKNYDDLHKSILACDDILMSVDKYLTSFQADLGVVSAEIETLQSRSAALNDRLENRKKVEVLLGPVVERLAISPVVVNKIVDGSLDETWIHALNELQARCDTLAAIDKEKKNIKALDDLKPLLDDLSDMAIERIRNHFATSIKSLRSPNTNAQVIQMNSFHKYKDLYTFLAKRQPKLGEDITQAYLNTMRWYYSSNFSRYLQSLKKLKLYATDQYDVIGENSSQRGQARSALMPGSKPATTVQPDPFNLGRRIDRLKTPSQNAIPSHVAEEESLKPSSHNFETPFLALNLALVDNACFEYTFLTSFFSPTVTYQKINAVFTAIFAPTLELASASTKSLINDSFDALGILLLVRLTQQLAFTLQRRKVPSLESYINGTNMVLWPRFQIIVDAHWESLRRLTASLPTRVPNSEMSTAPHPVTQRFANFLAGVLALSSATGDEEPVSNSLVRLRAEFEAFLKRMVQGFGAGDKGKKQRFLLNNYSLVLTVISDVGGKLADEQKKHFEALRTSI